MSTIIQGFAKIVIFACLMGGLALVFKTRTENKITKHENNNPKALALKKYFLDYRKPARVEIFNYTKKYDKDVNEILAAKIATQTGSDFYVTIQFFTDENDATAPLVAQIRFLDSKTDNLIKEQSINLE